MQSESVNDTLGVDFTVTLIGKAISAQFTELTMMGWGCIELLITF